MVDEQKRQAQWKLSFSWHIFQKRLVHDLADLMTILVVHTASGVADVVD